MVKHRVCWCLIICMIYNLKCLLLKWRTPFLTSSLSFSSHRSSSWKIHIQGLLSSGGYIDKSRSVITAAVVKPEGVTILILLSWVDKFQHTTKDRVRANLLYMSCRNAFPVFSVSLHIFYKRHHVSKCSFGTKSEQ